MRLTLSSRGVSWGNGHVSIVNESRNENGLTSSLVLEVSVTRLVDSGGLVLGRRSVVRAVGGHGSARSAGRDRVVRTNRSSRRCCKMQIVSFSSFAQRKPYLLLAVVGGGDRVEASLEAEDARSDEHVPTVDLLIGGVVAAGETSRVDESSEGVSEQVGTVGVELSSRVGGGQVNTRVVEGSNDLFINMSTSFSQ
jgi:hypothetical protein